MSERPIIFSGPMVSAILDGRKTQTRRVVKPQPDEDGLTRYAGTLTPWLGTSEREYSCPFGAPGDRLWVRETWSAEFEWPEDNGGISFNAWKEQPAAFRGLKSLNRLYFAADETIYGAGDGGGLDGPVGDKDSFPADLKWRPSIHMPRWASRITLEITSVRVERLQEISEGDAKAEGAAVQFRTVIPVDGKPIGATKAYTIPSSHRGGFANLWDSLNAKRGHGWDANPFCWVIEFRRLAESKAESVA